jgi:hypothetical protein
MNKILLDRFVRRGRLLIVDGTKWRWRCGKGGNVIAYSEHGERRCAGAWTIKGITPDEFDRGKWKITSSGVVKPSDVVTWLSTPKRRSNERRTNQSEVPLEVWRLSSD